MATVTKTTVTKTPVNQRSFRRRTLTPQPQAAITRTTVTQSAPNIQASGIQGSNRTARNRKRRVKQKLKAKLVNVATQTAPLATPNYFSRYFTSVDPSMELSVHKSIQTLFYPQQGIHRGIANGLETTALTLIQGSLELTCTPTNSVATFLFVPELFAQPAPAVNSPGFGVYSGNTVLTDPITSTAGRGAIAGPFATGGPQVAGRVVSFTLNIIPASTVLNRGGEGKLFYASDYGSLTWTRSDLDNLAISRSWDGLESMTMHWVPAEPENGFCLGINDVVDPAYGGVPVSALGGYVMVPGNANGVAWRFEWQVGIEYIPNAQFRPYVDRQPPKIRPDARYFINDLVQTHWTPLMISTFSDYQTRLRTASSLGGHVIRQYIDHAGLGGRGFGQQANLDSIAEEEKYEAEIVDNTPSLARRLFSNVANVACQTGEVLTGEDLCSGQGLLRAGSRLLGRRSGVGGPYALQM